MRDMYVVKRKDGYPLAIFGKENEAYKLANMVDGFVDPVPRYYEHRSAIKADSTIAYEADRVRHDEQLSKSRA